MEQMQMLSIDKALMLYELLKPHLPEMGGDEQEFLDFIGDIVESMRDTNPLAYVECLELLSGLDISEISKKTSLEALELFSIGLVDNYVFNLVKFGQSLGL